MQEMVILLQVIQDLQNQINLLQSSGGWESKVFDFDFIRDIHVNTELTIEELELKLNQQTQDYHFDMRNKQMEIVMQKNQILQLEMEIAELKDKLIELGEKL